MEPAEGAPQGWSQCGGRSHEGAWCGSTAARSDMKDAALSVGGIAPDEAQAQSIRAALRASVPTAFTLVDQIKVREVKAPEPARHRAAAANRAGTAGCAGLAADGHLPAPNATVEPKPRTSPGKRHLHQRRPRRPRLQYRRPHLRRSLRQSPRPNKSPPRQPRRPGRAGTQDSGRTAHSREAGRTCASTVS